MTASGVLLTSDALAVYEELWEEARLMGGHGLTLWFPISNCLRRMRQLSRSQADRRAHVIRLELRQKGLIAQVAHGSARVTVIGTDPQTW